MKYIILLGSSEYKAPYEDLENRMYSSLLETLQIAVSREKRRPSFPDCLYRNAVSDLGV